MFACVSRWVIIMGGSRGGGGGAGGPDPLPGQSQKYRVS